MTALTLATGAATASSGDAGHERVNVTAPAEAVRTIQVPAGDVMTSVELVRAGISADTLLTVSAFGTDDRMASLNSDR